jgi:heme A synthase
MLSRFFPALSLTTLVMVFLVILAGAVVRTTGSGMGCPDWPLCYGQIIPPIDDYKAWLEWIHRAAAAFIGLITLIVVAQALRSLKGRRSLQGASLALLVQIGRAHV